jgi:dihydrofolate reductase
MTSTVYYVAASLDGFIADAEGKLDWLFAFEQAAGVKDHYERFVSKIGAIAMGRDTLDFVVGEGHPWAYQGIPTWVFTTRPLPSIPGADLRVATDVETTHAAMVETARGKDIWMVGGGRLAAQFHDLGLLDELRLGVVPVFLERGIPVLPAATSRLELIGSEVFGMGLVELHYRFK